MVAHAGEMSRWTTRKMRKGDWQPMRASLAPSPRKEKWKNESDMSSIVLLLIKLTISKRSSGCEILTMTAGCGWIFGKMTRKRNVHLAQVKMNENGNALMDPEKWIYIR
jgi:hypothetical protein